jgi:FkbM family methyltransferase
MNVLYGVKNNYVDITEKVKKTGKIPYGDDNRSFLYGDPLFRTLKHININGKIYKHDTQLEIDFEKNTVVVDATIAKLTDIHSTLKLLHGSFNDEFPEQLMAVSFIKPDDVVLEIGGNIGRNSVVISKLLNDSSNLVVLESDKNISNQLEENKIVNNLSFHIESSALSKRKLIQKGWDTIPSNKVLPGYKEVSIISFDEIQEKYSKKFNVLVADCEGALFYIFQDFPDMLSSINTIIMENDYDILSHKQKVDEIMTLNGFKAVYTEKLDIEADYTVRFLCKENFYQVWQKY